MAELAAWLHEDGALRASATPLHGDDEVRRHRWLLRLGFEKGESGLEASTLTLAITARKQIPHTCVRDLERTQEFKTMTLQKPGKTPSRPGEYIERGPRGGEVPRRHREAGASTLAEVRALPRQPTPCRSGPDRRTKRSRLP